MMNYDTWKLITESLQGGVTLGLSRPNVVGGVVGAHSFSEEGFGKNAGKDYEDDDEGDEDYDDEDEYDGQQTDDGEDDDDGLDGDVIGSSSEDDGPSKGFPPDDSQDLDGLPTPDEAMLGDDEFGDEGDPFSPEDFFGPEGEEGGDFGGDEGGFDPKAPVSQGDDMNFLKDIDPSMLGDEFGGDDDFGGAGAGGGHDLGGLEGLDDLDGLDGQEGGVEEPCPDCNAEGEHEDGDPDCPSCQGVGFIDGGEGDDFGGDLGGLEGLDDLDAGFEDEPAEVDDDANFMSSLASFMRKENRKPRRGNVYNEFAPIAAAAAPALAGGGGAAAAGGAGAAGAAGGATSGGLMAGAGRLAAQMGQQAVVQQGANAMQNMTPQQQQQMAKKMVKFMTKDGRERKFMAKDGRKCKSTHCEQDAFMNSLTNQARGTTWQKYKSGLTEDALLMKSIDPNYDEFSDYYAPQPGQKGFAPSGRVGGIGGGYTKNDFKDIPTLGESTGYMTLDEYAAAKRKALRRRKSR